MGVKYVHRQSDTSADAFPARANAAGIMVDSDTNKLSFNPDGTVRVVTDSGSANTLRADASVTAADTITITAADSGKLYVSSKASATQVWTLPAAAAGLTYSFAAKDAGTEIRVATGTASLIRGKTQPSETGTAIVTTATTGLLLNTAATNVVGDFVTLMCDGTDWWMTAQGGIWSAT